MATPEEQHPPEGGGQVQLGAVHILAEKDTQTLGNNIQILTVLRENITF